MIVVESVVAFVQGKEDMMGTFVRLQVCRDADQPLLFSLYLCPTVTDVEGRLTAVGAMAYEMCRLCQRCAGHRGGRGSLVNITQQRMSFVVQQAMVVAESVQTGSTSTVTASHASWRAHTQVH